MCTNRKIATNIDNNVLQLHTEDERQTLSKQATGIQLRNAVQKRSSVVSLIMTFRLPYLERRQSTHLHL